MQPTAELSREFICDAVIWSLFAPSNQTVSLRNVEYEGEVYRMPNNLFPFLLEEISTWKISDAEIRMQVAVAREDRFAASGLKKILRTFRTRHAQFCVKAERFIKSFTLNWKI